MNISLVLGSGGARGYAHIGVIETLLEKNYKTQSISGTSMGALIGGLYACGKLEEFKQWVLTLNSFDMLKLLDLSFAKNGLIQGEKIFAKIEHMIGDVNIEELPISYTAVAADIVNQKEVWIQEGKLIDAIRASIAIPTLFTPKKIGDSYLVDGGILNPLPVAPTISDTTDMTIAIGLYADTKIDYELQIPHKEKEKGIDVRDKLIEFFEKANSFMNKTEDESKNKFENMGFYNIIWHTIDTMQNTINNYKLAGYPADLEINISKYACETYDFDKAYEMIEIGRIEARKYL
jgi:NTE family protein